MSTDDRLRRLGLYHLRDQPDALRRELARRVAEGKKVEARIEREMEEIRRRLAANVPTARVRKPR
jgi:hypothetical protein